jgi:hypothetical protein
VKFKSISERLNEVAGSSRTQKGLKKIGATLYIEGVWRDLEAIVDDYIMA